MLQNGSAYPRGFSVGSPIFINGLAQCGEVAFDRIRKMDIASELYTAGTSVVPPSETRG